MLFASHALLVQMISFGLRPAISYAILDLGYSSSWLTFVVVAFSLPALLLALPVGRLADRWGERVCLIVGGVGLLTSSFGVLAGSTSLVWLLSSTVLLSIGLVFSAVAEHSIAGRRALAAGTDHSFAGYTFATSLGQAVGPMLLLLPRGSAPLSVPVTAVAWACVVAAVVCLGQSFSIGSGRSRVESHSSPRVTNTRGLVTIPGMPRALAISGVALASIDVLVFYLPAVAHGRGVAPWWVTLFLVVRSMASMASRLASGVLTARGGRTWLVVWGAACAAVAMSCCALPLPVFLLAVAAAVYGFSVGVIQPVTMSWVTSLAPSGSRASALALRIAGNRLGQLTVPAIAGAVAGLTGPPGSLIAGGAALFAAAALASGMPDGRVPGHRQVRATG